MEKNYSRPQVDLIELRENIICSSVKIQEKEASPREPVLARKRQDVNEKPTSLGF